MTVKRIDTAEDFNVEYPRVRNWLIKALRRQIDGGNEAELLTGLAGGHFELWTTPNAACVSKIIDQDGTRLLSLYLIGGKSNDALNEVLESQSALEDWAKANHCKGFFGVGRPGWENALAPHGFKVLSVNLYKEFQS